MRAGWAQTWTEAVKLAGAKPVAWYADGPAAGGPAVTRHELGDGQAWYVSACTDAADHGRPARRRLRVGRPHPRRGRRVGPAAGAGGRATWRSCGARTGDRRFIVLINHGEESADVMVGGRLVVVPAGDVTVIKGE